MTADTKQLVFLGGGSLARDAISEALGRLGIDVTPVASVDQAVEALRRHDADLLVDPELVPVILRLCCPPEPGDHGADRADLHLTATERRVLALAADGHPNKQIATRLGLSPLTVKNHLARIRARLGASDKAHAVALAIRHGLLP